ncbi:Na+/H+ antiporter subunit D [Mobilicoccus caccae]|uniref:Cation antiporter NADH dehydrogenase subunit n=1 Tax=Mobilicoccus caccae TaxID=1859295 RepID=A0ABQ6IMX6_9MICO|nr:Na+/H+ antiporter subunit D [Mobilicoccus caccae]GMA39275.1 putative cation antiporter NADH dehydrogenase subunit [Mobilicoccus caccae]
MNGLASVLVPLPVVLPLVAAGLTLVVTRRIALQRAISLTALGVVLTASIWMVFLADAQGPLVVHAGGWEPPMGIPLVVDRLSAIMLVVSVIVTGGVLLFAIGQGRSGGDESDGDSPLPIFHPTMMVLISGVATTFISGDLFHIYVGFEMLLIASFVLLTLGGSPQRVSAGTNYVFVSLLSSLFFLSAIALVYAATGTVTLAQLAGRLDALSPEAAVTIQVLLLIGFAVKAAVFPMSGWLPDSYPTASASVTAVFAGLLTKVGVYAIIRTQTLLFPHGAINNLLLWAALLTMLVGILGAIAQNDIKRLLSFTLVSHIGYLLFGVALANQAGLSGAIFYMVHHIVIQTTLFLVVGLVEWRSGTTSLDELGGLAKTAPFIAILFFVPALNLAGIPPFSGFLGKVGIFQGGVQEGGWLSYLVIASAVLTSLLTLYAVARVWARAFWQRPVTELVAKSVHGSAPSDTAAEGNGGRHVAAVRRGGPDGPLRNPASTRYADVATGPLELDPERLARLQVIADRPVPRGTVLPTVLLVVVGISLTVVAGPLYGITDRAAADLLVRTPYIEAVFPGGAP